MADKIVLNGGRKLRGHITISGAKNAALPIMAASLLTRKEVTLHNVPIVRDVQMMVELLRCAGAKVIFKNNTVCVKATKVNGKHLSNNVLASEIRSVNGMFGALLHRLKRIKLPFPGGCEIGARKIDLHILSLQELGVEVTASQMCIIAESDKLHGCHIVLPYPSVGVTENLMIAASLAKGVTTITNVAREPEIVDLANFLNSMGAEIEDAGTNFMKITGVEELSGTEYTIIPDRIETGTYIIAAALTNGDILLENVDLSLLEEVVQVVERVGVKIEEFEKSIHVISSGKLYPVDIITEPYPGFPTDMQPIITPLLTMADGVSKIEETIFERRFNHIPELTNMGANIKIKDNRLFIKGPSKLKGTKVKALDLRAGGSLMLAGLVAEGQTIIEGANQIFRGYENPLTKLKKVGADCTLID
jgi:UDP-N-acetylglucosamine 1-carboxyvinyltransferase